MFLLAGLIHASLKYVNRPSEDVHGEVEFRSRSASEHRSPGGLADGACSKPSAVSVIAWGPGPVAAATEQLAHALAGDDVEIDLEGLAVRAAPTIRSAQNSSVSEGTTFFAIWKPIACSIVLGFGRGRIRRRNAS